jgi:hypothetical protein
VNFTDWKIFGLMPPSIISVSNKPLPVSYVLI